MKFTGKMFVDSGSLSIADLSYYLENAGGIYTLKKQMCRIVDLDPGKYRIGYEVLTGHSEPIKGEVELVLKSGKLAVGDACYFFQDEPWQEFLDKTHLLRDVPKARMLKFDTGGDGIFLVLLKIEKI